MFLSNLSIKRPVFATVLMLALVTLGLFSYRRLAIDMFPDVEIPVVSIVTKFAGASPETVEREVTKRIEEAVNPISGVKHVMSYSRESVSTVVVEFHLEVRLNDAAQEARAKVSAIRGDLPQGIEEPIIQKLDFAAMPIASLAVRSATMSPKDLSTLVEKRVKRRLESIAGVGRVDLVGQSKREVNVEIAPRRIEALGMGVDQVIAGLRGENVNTPLGRLTREGAEYPLRIDGKPEAVAQYGDMVIGHAKGRPIALAEVAKVTDGIEEMRSLALVNGVPAVGLDILKQSGANTVGVVEKVKKTVADLRQELPADVTIDMVRDGSIMIRESVADVQDTMIIGGILTILIVFVFLNSWRSTVITGLTLPISVISAFIVMNFMNMTLNVMTLMGLSLAIGLLIDDAIVVRENIVRHLEKGKDHFTASRDGTAEIGLAVLATTFSIVAVFVPVAFMKGIVGRFFFQFGITVTFAVLVSLFVSFTLDPMLSSRWHDPDIDRTGRRHLLARWLDRFNDWFDRSAETYKNAVGWALDHRKSVFAVALAAFAGGMGVFVTLPSNFMQEYDRAEFQINFTTAPSASLTESRGRLDAVLDKIKAVQGVSHTYATIGAGDQGTVRDGIVYVKLLEKAHRRQDQFEIQRHVRDLLAQVPGILPAIVEVGRLHGEKQFEVDVRGEDIEMLKAYGLRLKQSLSAMEGIVDLEMTLEHDIPEFRLVVDRQRAVDLGVMTQQISTTVGALVGGQAVTTYEDEDGDAVDVRVRLPLDRRQDPAHVQRLHLSVADGDNAKTLVPLGELVSFKMAASPSQIDRRDLTRQVVITANLDGLAMGDAMAKVKKEAAGLNMAPGYRIGFAGEAEDMVESFGYMAEALLLAVIFVYLILAAQFESFLDPLAIMFSLPLSIVGMAVMLRLTGDCISIMSLIGLIMLMGLVTKNAILLVDYAKILRAGGMDRREALITAGRTRLRPIMMTTAAMVFGMVPLALGLGEGAEMRAPMARAVIGGLITSTALTLLVVPVMVTFLEDAWQRLRGRKAALRGAVAAAMVVVALALPGDAAALTLDQAVATALARNKDIAMAMAYQQEVQGRYVEERAAAFPQFTVSAGALSERDESQRMVKPATMPLDDRIYLGKIGLTQALYTWGQVGAAIRAAKVGLATADDQLRLFRQAVVRDVTAAFYDLLLARQLAAIASENLAQRERHLDEAKRKLAVGMATDYDVLAATVAVANARPEVIRTANLVTTAAEQLGFLLGGTDAAPDAEGSLDTPVTEPYPLAEPVLGKALANRPEIAELRHRCQMAAELIGVYNAGDRPRLDLKADYGWQEMEMGGKSENGETATAGVFLTYPIFDGLRTRGKVAQAKSQKQRLELELAKAQDQIKVQAVEAANAVGQSGEIVKGLAGTVTQAQRLLAMAETGFVHGVKTRLDVEDAQLNLKQAQGNLARARRDYLVALVNLEWVAGSLMEGIAPGSAQ